MFDSTKELLDKIRLGEDSFLEEEPTPRITERSNAARSSAGAASSLRAGVDRSTVHIEGPLRGLCTVVP